MQLLQKPHLDSQPQFGIYAALLFKGNVNSSKISCAGMLWWQAAASYFVNIKTETCLLIIKVHILWSKPGAVLLSTDVLVASAEFCPDD